MVQIWLKTSPVEVKSAGSSWYKKAGIAAELLCAVIHCGLVWFAVVHCGLVWHWYGTLWFGLVWYGVVETIRGNVKHFSLPVGTKRPLRIATELWTAAYFHTAAVGEW